MSQILSEFDALLDNGRENRALIRPGENAQEIANWKLAERVGFVACDFRKPSVYSGFQSISRNRSDLASSKLRQRFRPFAGICRFFYFNDTRNGTRRDALVNRPPNRQTAHRPTIHPAIAPKITPVAMIGT